MLQHFLKVHSVNRVSNQALTDKVLGLRAYLYVVWERVSDRLNLLVRLLDILRLKRRTAIKHGIQDHTNRPVVDFIAVSTDGV